MTLEALSAATGLHPGLVDRLVEYGLLEPVNAGESVVRFDASALRRVCTICRLRDDLGINLAGIAAVLDLLARVEVLRRGSAATLRPNRVGGD
jgi:chaperone modulatory protein CbpM